jgi:hypothetical protein
MLSTNIKPENDMTKCFYQYLKIVLRTLDKLLDKAFDKESLEVNKFAKLESFCRT